MIHPSEKMIRIDELTLYQGSLSVKIVDFFTASKVVASVLIPIFALRDP